MALFRKEIQEFLDEVTGQAHADEPLGDRIEHIAVEFFDVVRVSLDAIDEDDREADLAELSAELQLAAMLVVDKLLADRKWLKATVKGFLPTLVEAAVDAATGYSAGIVQFSTQEIAPRFARIKRIAERGELAFGG